MAVEEEEEEEEKPIYNPLNLPLGFDGKPIPYWLYKLHGLNLEFKCEICGNYSYWGPVPPPPPAPRLSRPSPHAPLASRLTPHASRLTAHAPCACVAAAV